MQFTDAEILPKISNMRAAAAREKNWEAREALRSCARAWVHFIRCQRAAGRPLTVSERKQALQFELEPSDLWPRR